MGWIVHQCTGSSAGGLCAPTHPLPVGNFSDVMRAKRQCCAVKRWLVDGFHHPRAPHQMEAASSAKAGPTQLRVNAGNREEPNRAFRVGRKLPVELVLAFSSFRSAILQLYPESLYTLSAEGRSDHDRPAGLDNNTFKFTGDLTVNPNTRQKSSFCARQQVAAGLALYICPERPGAAS